MSLNDNDISKLRLLGMDTVDAALCHVEHGIGRGDRRIREKAAVRRLTDYYFGKDAVYGHRSDGSPYIEGQSCSISVSHSRDFAAMAVCRTHGSGLGIDIEQMRPAQLRRVAERFLGETELLQYDTDSLLLWAWTAKEAVYKAAAVSGLSGPEIILPLPMCNEASVGERRFKLSTFYTGSYCCVVALENKEP